MRPLAALLALLLSFGVAQAFPLPSVEEIEALQAAGQWEQRRAELMALREQTSVRATDAELLELIDAGYGLPVQSYPPGAPYASPLANLDGNALVDERDVLELGFGDHAGGDAAVLSRAASVTTPYGTVAGGDAPKILILLIKFPDKAPTSLKNRGTAVDVTHDIDWAESRWLDLNEPADLEDTSVAYYFKTASYGKLEVTGDVFNHPDVCDANGWITSTTNYSTLNNDASAWQAVVENAIAQVDPYIDFGDYDSNGDGHLDGLVTIYAGADNGGSPGCLWYFRWVNSPDYTTSDDGIRIGAGVWVSEQGYIYHFCHEFGHELGLPDLYDIGGAPAMPGAGIWTLMDAWTTGSTGTGVIPALPDAWSRMRLGWVEPIDVPTTTGLAFELNRASSAASDDTVLRVWRNGHRGQQCFLCEFRDTDHGFDQNLPDNADGGGLAIWHVDEARTSGVNRDNSFNPQRVAMETANGQSGTPTQANNVWREGYNGADSSDDFDNSTTPSSKDNAGAATSVSIQPGAVPSGSDPMSITVANAGTGLPTLAIDSPADGATVSSDVTVDVTSDAADRVEYWIDGCLKHIEAGPAPYDGFSWDTLSSPNGVARLRIAAFNSGQVVRVAERSVTVDNPQASGASLPFSEDFSSYAAEDDPNLLGLWNLHTADAFGVSWRLLSARAGVPAALALSQDGYDFAPPLALEDDPNAGRYQGQDSDWLMSPRLNLAGWTDIELAFKTIFRSTASGDQFLQLQVSTDDGATWQTIRGFTNRDQPGSPYDTGWWDLLPLQFGDFNRAAQQSVDLTPYSGEQVYLRWQYLGGAGFSTGLALADIEITGTAVQLSSASPARGVVGTSVTLGGEGFGASQGSGEVRFSNGAGGHMTASVQSWSDTEITCAVPAGAKSDPAEGVWIVRDDGAETNRLGFAVILPPPTLGGIGQL